MEHLIVTALSRTPGSTPVLADVRVLPPKGPNTSGYLDVNTFSQHTAWAHGFMHTYALWLGPVLLAAVFVAAYAVIWWWRAPRATSLLLLGGIGTVIALGFNQLVAHAAQELRPYVAHPHALVLVPKTGDYAFPSDHSVVAGGLTLSLLLVVGRGVWQHRRGVAGDPGGEGASEGNALSIVRTLAVVNVVLGLFLCFARVYVGAHYPGDVVAGYLLAAVVVVAVSLLRPFVYRLVDLVEPTPFGAVLRRPASVAAGGGEVPGPVLDPTAAGERQRSVS